MVLSPLLPGNALPSRNQCDCTFKMLHLMGNETHGSLGRTSLKKWISNQNQEYPPVIKHGNPPFIWFDDFTSVWFGDFPASHV